MTGYDLTIDHLSEGIENTFSTIIIIIT